MDYNITAKNKGALSFIVDIITGNCVIEQNNKNLKEQWKVEEMLSLILMFYIRLTKSVKCFQYLANSHYNCSSHMTHCGHFLGEVPDGSSSSIVVYVLVLQKKHFWSHYLG